MKNGTFILNFTFFLLTIVNTRAMAQNHKGIAFQGVIKLPSGDFPTRSGLLVNARILSSNDCILREEQFVGVNVSNGYINIPIGTGATGGYDPGLTLKQVMDNSSVISGLTCLNTDGTVSNSVTSYNPASSNGVRKFRLSVTIDSVPIVADFNMRSMAYAVNAESLNGKTETDFVNTSSAITQSSVESWFSSAILGQLLAGTFNAPTATSAQNVTGTVAIANGGTGATTAAAARTNLGLASIASSGSASDLSTGQVPAARLGSGTADASTFLRGDGSWAAISSIAAGVTSVAGKTGAVALQSSDLGDFATAVDTRIQNQKAQNNGLATLDNSGKIPSSQLSLAASEIPNLDASKITSGTLTQNVNSSLIRANTGTFNDLKLFDGVSQYLTMSFQSGGTGYSLVWPATVGNNGQVLQTDASGNLSWATLSSGVTSVAVSAPLASTGGTTPTLSISSGSSNGQVLRWNGSAWAPNFVSMFDLRSGVTGSQAFGGVGCLANQTLTWTAATDNLACSDISISPSQVTGLAASATTDTTDAANITSGILNINRIPSLDVSKLTTGVLPIARGGTNSSAALNNNRVMVSSGGAIIEGAALTADKALVSDANGIPLASSVSTTELGYLSGVTSAVQTQIDGMAQLAGRAGGQNLRGGTAASENLVLESTTHATKGYVLLNPNGGHVGIGTSSPTTGMVEIANSKNNTTADYAIWLNHLPTYSSTGTYTSIGMNARAYPTISSGVTNSGQVFSFVAQAKRGTSVGDDGAQAGNLISLSSQYGHASNGSATTSTSNIYGLKLDPAVQTGTVSNLYDIFISTAATGGTLTNHWAFYQQDPSALSYFGGKVGIGQTPAAALHVSPSSVSATQEAIRIVDQGTGANEGGWIQFDSGGKSDQVRIGQVSEATGSSLIISTNSADSGTPTERLRIKASGNVGIGTSNPSAKLEVQGQIIAKENIVATGATINFALGNVQTLSAPGTATLTLQNLVNGGHYTVIIEDTTSRTYDFSSCGTVRANPALAATSGRSIYSILKTSSACYITWQDGF